MTDDLIVVDGHSTDGSGEIAAECGARVVLDNQKGKGDAVRTGLAAARYSITVFMDADGSHDPATIPALVAPIARDEADLVIGSRMLGGSEELFGSMTEVIRLMGSLIINLSINYRYGLRNTDYLNGFRAIRTEVGLAVGLTSNIATIEHEMAIKCLKYGYRVTECPAHESRRKGGESKIKVWRVAPIFVWNLICRLLEPRGDRAANEASRLVVQSREQVRTEEALMAAPNGRTPTPGAIPVGVIGGSSTSVGV